jgi:hypothetical protein
MTQGSDTYIDDGHHIPPALPLRSSSIWCIFITVTTIIIITYIITRSKFKKCTQPVRYLSENFGFKPQRRETSAGSFTAFSSLWQMCMSDVPIALMVVDIVVPVVVVGCAATAPTIIPISFNGCGFVTKTWRVDNTHKHRLALDHPPGRPPRAAKATAATMITAAAAAEGATEAVVGATAMIAATAAKAATIVTETTAYNRVAPY